MSTTPTWLTQGREPTGPELLTWLNALDPTDLDRAVAGINANARLASECIRMNHDALFDEVERLRDLKADVIRTNRAAFLDEITNPAKSLPARFEGAVQVRRDMLERSPADPVAVMLSDRVPRGREPAGPALATAEDVIEGRARYADTPGGHADRRALDHERGRRAAKDRAVALTPACVHGWTRDQVAQIVGTGLAEFDSWMFGQTYAICDDRPGRRCAGLHGPVTYTFDLTRWLEGAPVVD